MDTYYIKIYGKWTALSKRRLFSTVISENTKIGECGRYCLYVTCSGGMSTLSEIYYGASYTQYIRFYRNDDLVREVSIRRHSSRNNLFQQIKPKLEDILENIKEKVKIERSIANLEN